jgi:flagellar hook-length control protein FliK
MKIQLNPEGLGQVNMKVAVQNGQVNIQMVTDSHEAKRTLESGMSDLRSHLAANKLNLDLVKVDVARDAGSDFAQNQQRQQQEAAQDMAREFARGFLGNFRDERQGDRDGIFNDPNRYRSYASASPVKGSIDSVSTTGGAPSSSRAKNRRLNVVA